MRVLIAGDFHTGQSEKIIVGDRLNQLIASCDYSVLNLESPIVCNNISKLPKKSGPRLKQSKESLYWLEKNGFNCLMCANNHIYDYGASALNQTIALAKESFYIAGVGNWSEAYKPLILENDNKTIAIINFAELQCGVLCDSSNNNLQGCAWINHPYVFNLITETKKECDYIIAISHAGLENVEVPLPEWREIYKQLIDYGCDAVIGGHPHICQGVEFYKKKPIVYSLGNFYFDPLSGNVKSSWFRGEVVVIDLKEDLALKVYGINSNNNTVELINEEEWNSEINRLNGLLEADKYDFIVNEICNDKLDYYYNQFSSGGCIHIDKHIIKSIARKVLGKCNEANLLNAIQCESHRWCISRALRNKINKNNL